MTDDSYKDKFLDILEENIGIIIKISRVYTKVEQDKEDLINDITLELWKSFKNFTGNSKISTWIYRVALNTSMNYKRKKKMTSFLIKRKTIFIYSASLNAFNLNLTRHLPFSKV